MTEDDEALLRKQLIAGEWCVDDLAELLRVLYPDLEPDMQEQIETTFETHELDL